MLDHCFARGYKLMSYSITINSDGSLGFAPFLVTSNWANTRDLFSLALTSVGGDPVEARRLVHSWNSNNSAFGSIHRKPWSIAYDVLDSMGLMVHDDLASFIPL